MNGPVGSKGQERLTLHQIALPHIPVSDDYNACAYNQKIKKFATMMTSLGHEVYTYASEGSEVDGELVITHSKDDQSIFYDNSRADKEFYDIDWNTNSPHWQFANGKAINRLRENLKPRDFICVIGGVCQKPIADAFPAHTAVEHGIGYKGIFAKYKVFESYAWMHYNYGLKNIDDGQFYDVVIPNFFNPDHFPFVEEKEDYFLYIGRMITRKGWEVAVQTTEKIGAKLIMAGQVGDEDLSKLPSHVEHVGYADIQKRGELMSKAKGVFVPTYYIGPFEGVHVESMLTGTPVITTDWGVFPETVIEGVTGFRARTLGEFVRAAQRVDELDPKAIRVYAEANFSMDRVKYQYQAYFNQLLDLWDEGWPLLNDPSLGYMDRYARY